MAFFNFWTFGTKAEEARTRAAAKKAMLTIDIDVEISAHINWKTRLLAYLEGHSVEDLRPDLICHDDRCELGKWIHSDGAKELGDFAAFGALRTSHKLFHHNASSVVALHQAGKQAEAKALLEGEYEKTSSMTTMRLRDLKSLASLG